MTPKEKAIRKEILNHVKYRQSFRKEITGNKYFKVGGKFDKYYSFNQKCDLIEKDLQKRVKKIAKL